MLCGDQGLVNMLAIDDCKMLSITSKEHAHIPAAMAKKAKKIAAITSGS